MSQAQPDETIADATLASTLDTLDDAVNYMRWIVDMVASHLANPILELGAGHGTFTASLAELGDVTAVEPGGHAATMLRSRFDHDPRVTVLQSFVDELPHEPPFGSAVMINVLEHIKDDAATLVAIRERLQPGGRIAIWVPAFQLLYSPFDRQLGHYRRYRRPQIEQLLRSAGFEVVDSRYVNLPGWFSWLLISRVLRRTPASGALVTIFDRFVVPVIRRVESRVRPPFGQSILIIGQRP